MKEIKMGNGKKGIGKGELGEEKGEKGIGNGEKKLHSPLSTLKSKTETPLSKLHSKDSKLKSKNEFDKKLLDFICCPNCQNDFEYKEVESKLVCCVCKKEFLIKDSIPILIEMK